MSDIVDMAGLLNTPIDRVMLDKLDSLPDGSIVRDRNHTPFQKDGGQYVALYGSEIDMAQLLPPAIFLRIHGPIAVLWTPEERR